MSFEDLLKISGVGGASTIAIIILYKIFKKKCVNSSCVSSDTDGLSIHIGSPRAELQVNTPIQNNKNDVKSSPIPVFVRQMRTSQHTTTEQDNNIYE